MAELYGRATGSVGGRGGTMHLADLDRGYLGGNGIVGAGVGIAMGAALACQLKGEGVAVGFVGDGGPQRRPHLGGGEPRRDLGRCR